MSAAPARVLMTADAVGGVWDYSLELSRGLARAGIEVVLAVMGPPPDAGQAAAAAEIPGLELAVGPYALEWMTEPWGAVEAAGEWLLALQRRLRCDLVHLNGYSHGRLPFGVPRLVVAHSCVLSWWRAVKREDAPAEWDRYRDEVTAGLRAAELVVAPSGFMRDAVWEHYGPLRRTEVVWNGRDAASYAAGEKVPFVLSAGRLWDEAKNAAVLARVAPRLPWPVKIAGAASPPGGGGRGELGAAALLGRLPPGELRALMAAAPIYALPARYEPFGLTVLEAALSECALVLGDVPSLRELWRGAALFVDPDDDQALETALLTLMNQPELTALLASRARERAARYGAAEMVRRYLDLYDGLCAASLTPEVPYTCVS